MHVHEDIQIGVTQGLIGNDNCDNNPKNESAYSQFTNLRDEVILQWIERIVPDVFVVGNMVFQLRNYVK